MLELLAPDQVPSFTPGRCVSAKTRTAPATPNPFEQTRSASIMANPGWPVSINAVRVHPAVLSSVQRADAFGSTSAARGAECVYDPELHTGPTGEGESAVRQAAREQVAREVCSSCPALLACGVYALTLAPAAGVWAGITADEIAEFVELPALAQVA